MPEALKNSKTAAVRMASAAAYCAVNPAANMPLHQHRKRHHEEQAE
jgi:hypothetical protein